MARTRIKIEGADDSDVGVKRKNDTVEVIEKSSNAKDKKIKNVNVDTKKRERKGVGSIRLGKKDVGVSNQEKESAGSNRRGRRGNSSSGLVRKSVGAALLIGLGDYALLKLGEPIGPVIFSLGLLGVCYMGQNLFTGKCGFLFEDKIKIFDLMTILVVNLVAGYLIGLLFSSLDTEVFSAATTKMAGWGFTWAFFGRAIMCGVIMYIAVYMFRKGTPLGIIFGIPLFIFCGFQHCIANVITMGAARAFDWSLVLAVLGNFVGSLVMWWISRESKDKV